MKVSAIAFASALGMAVIAGAGTASAEPGDGSTDSPSSAQATHSDSTSKANANGSAPASSEARTSGSAVKSPLSSAETSDASTGKTSTAPSSGVASTASSSSDTVDPQTDVAGAPVRESSPKTTDSAPPSSPAGDQTPAGPDPSASDVPERIAPPTSASDSLSSNKTVSPTESTTPARDDAPARSDAMAATHTVGRSEAVANRAAGDDVRLSAAAQGTSSDATAQNSTIAVVSAAPAAAPVVDFFTAAIKSVTAFLGLSPQSSALSPQAPAGPLGSVLEFLFVGLRRVGGLLVNSNPTLTTSALEQRGAGIVTGNLIVDDAEGDAVVLTVSRAPTKGSVILNADGSFVYEAGDALAASGGSDTFDVYVDDEHRSLLTLGGRGIDLSLFGRSGSITVPVTVTVAPAAAYAPNSESTRFTVVNLTSNPLLYRGISYLDGDVTRPRVGTVLASGESLTFDLTRYFAASSRAKAEFGETSAAGFSVEMSGAALAVGGISISCASSTGGACETVYDQGQGGYTLARLEDRPNTVVNVPADPRQSTPIFEFLDKACGSGGAATACGFVSSREERTYSNPQLVDFVRNDVSADFPFNKTFSTTFSQSISTSVGGKVSTNLTKILAAEVSASSGRTDATSRTFQQNIAGTVAPNETVDLFSQSPVYRSYGTLTVVVGNTTYIAKDVYLDSPRPDGYNRWTLKTRPKAGSESGLDDTDGGALPSGPQADSSNAVRVSTPPRQSAGPLTGLFDVLSAITRQLVFGGNVAPSAAADTPVQLSRGVVTGTVAASDANQDPLTYRVTDLPSRGAVTIDAAGNYQYTPDPALLSAGGDDSFTVTVNDGHYGPTGSTVVPVSVRVTPPGVGTASSQTFEVVNLSRHRLTYVGSSGAGALFVDKAPTKGAIFRPGDVASFQLGTVTLGSKDHPVTVDFVAPTGERFSANLVSNDLGNMKVSCGRSDGGACGTSGKSIVSFLDKPDTAITLSPADAADLLNQCGGGNARTECKVKLPPNVDRQDIEGPGTPYGAAVTNLTNRPVVSTITVSQTVSQSTSANVNVKASSNLLKFLDVEFNASYGVNFTKSLTYSRSEAVPVGLGKTVYGLVQPVLRRTPADFTIYLGNTTYTVKGVNLDYPVAGGVTYKEGEPPLT